MLREKEGINEYIAEARGPILPAFGLVQAVFIQPFFMVRPCSVRKRMARREERGENTVTEREREKERERERRRERETERERDEKRERRRERETKRERDGKRERRRETK